MKIFISWSGSLSHEIAKILNEWIQNVIHAAKPWLSSHDIDAGSRWFSKIGSELASANFGILCMTKENLSSPWILFEAGALSKSLEKGHVCPLRINISNADLIGPLANFNTIGIDKNDILKLLETINSSIPDTERLQETRLLQSFNMWWPELKDGMAKAIELDAKTKGPEIKLPQRSTENILDEVLELSRQTLASINNIDMRVAYRVIEKIAGSNGITPVAGLWDSGSLSDPISTSEVQRRRITIDVDAEANSRRRRHVAETEAKAIQEMMSKGATGTSVDKPRGNATGKDK